MDLRETAADRAFRQEVRAFIAANLPQDLKDKSERGLRMHVVDGQRWHKSLASDGMIALGAEDVQKSMIVKQVLGL